MAMQNSRLSKRSLIFPTGPAAYLIEKHCNSAEKQSGTLNRTIFRKISLEFGVVLLFRFRFPVSHEGMLLGSVTSPTPLSLICFDNKIDAHLTMLQLVLGVKTEH